MIGKELAHYDVLASIGAGGIGEVYRARDRKLQREIAIKILPSGLASGAEEQERLRREARTLAALNHPNIVTVYSVEETAGTHFVTMELLDGETLATIVARGALPEDRFLGLALQLLDAMREAHAHGVVHRDLKPGNIMITADQRLKVLDFGLASVAAQAAFGSAEDLSTRLTQPGMILGTISYLSPEQAEGKPVDHRSDIFSLGIVLYEMSVGRHPFTGTSGAAMVSAILRDAPAPFAERDAPWLRRLRGVLERCMEKDPSRRYQQVADIIQDLNRLKAGMPTASLATASTADLVRAGRAALAQHAWSKAFELLQQADAESQLSPDDLQRLAEAAWWTGRWDESCRILERSYAGFVEAENMRRAAMMCVKLTESYHFKGAQSVSAGWLKRAERLLENDEGTVEYGYLLRFQALLAFEVNGDGDSALKLSNEVFEIAKRTGDKTLLALSIQDRGRILVSRGDVAEGMALLDEAMAQALSGELDPLTVAKTYCNMISTCEHTADYRRASEWSAEAVQWCEPHAGSPFPGRCSVYRAGMLRLRGSMTEAEAELRRVCADPRGYMMVAAMAYYELGEIRRRVGDYAGAEQAFREAHERGHDPVPGLPLLLLAQGKTDAARSLITRALSAMSLPLDRMRLLPAQVRIALAAEDFESARTSLEELDSIAAQFGAAAFEAVAAEARGSLDLTQGDFEAACKRLRRALTLWIEVDLPYEAAMTRVLLARTYRGMGDAANADLEMRAARSAFERLGAHAVLGELDAVGEGRG